MKKVLLILLVSYAMIFPQDEESKNPNVELPDFVITGSDVVSIRHADKIKPDFISTITSDFIFPSHSPDDLGLKQLSNPIKEDLKLLDTTHFAKGSIKAEAGIYTLPGGELSYAYPFNNGILNANVGGSHQRAYVDNSDRYYFYGGAGLQYLLPMNNDVLPGTKFNLNGDYNSYSYKLFASDDPEMKRSKNEGNYYLGIKNTSWKTFIFDLNLNNKFTSLVEDQFTENLINASGMASLQFSDFSIGVKSNYEKQYLTTDSLGSVNSDYFFVRPIASFEILNTVKAKVGYTFTNSGGMRYDQPYASFGLRVSKNLILIGEYAPHGELITSGMFLRQNDYFNATGFANLFFKKSTFFDVVLKYEYGKYYQLDAGVKYFKSKNLPYFTASNMSGQFDIATVDVNEINVYFNALFHTGPYGVLYGNVDYYRLQNNASKRIPYYPWLKANLTYGYEFTKGFLVEPSVLFNSDRYTDISNSKKLSAFIDVGVKLTYKINPNFIINLKVMNLLNRNIYYWDGYKQKTADLTFGLNYLFD
ncbi:hypothetical protein LJE86_17210 [bacterium BMS3Abin03]|nr:hypothetical protein [bacterium BMS3Abin03]